MGAERSPVLTPEIVGHIQAAIQWVSRAGKPLAIIGSYILTEREAERLADELEACLERFEDACSRDVKGFVRHQGENWTFGLYREPWVLEAYLWDEEGPCPFDGQWLMGLLCGYDAASIQTYLNAHSRRAVWYASLVSTPIRRDARASSPDGRTFLSGRTRRVEIYDPSASTAQPCSTLTSRCPTPR